MSFQSFPINVLELLTVMVALKLWGSSFTGQKVHILFDNLASVSTLTTGRARAPMFQACHREISLLKAKFDFHLKVSHVKGKDNRAADLLSRWHLNQDFGKKFISEFSSVDVPLTEVAVSPELFEFSYKW